MNKNKTGSAENMLERCVADCEKAVLVHALVRTRGNQSAAAMLLGTSKSTLANKVHKYGINCAEYKNDPTIVS